MMRAISAVPVLLVLSLAGLAAGFLWSGGGGKDPRVAAAASDTSIGDFTPVSPPRPAPALSFTSRAGEPRHLADFRGKVLLVNLWATWCGPCVREMPSLERLQAALGDRLTVLAISEDRGGAARRRALHRRARAEASCDLSRRGFRGAIGIPSARAADDLPRRCQWRHPRHAGRRRRLGFAEDPRAGRALSAGRGYLGRHHQDSCAALRALHQSPVMKRVNRRVEAVNEGPVEEMPVKEKG